MLIVIDSNVLLRDCRLTSPSIRQIEKALEHCDDLHLAIPEIVIDEAASTFEKMMRAENAGLRKVARAMRRLSDVPTVAPLSDADIENLRDAYRNNIVEWAARLGASTLAYPTTPHRDVVARLHAGRRPFKGEEDGYRDHLIWLSVLDVASSTGDGLVFVTDNVADFATKDGDLHPHLVEDVINLGLPADRIRRISFNGLTEIVKPCLEQADRRAQLDDIRRALEREAYGQLQLTDTLPDVLRDALQNVDLGAFDVEFPPEFEEPTVTTVYGIDDVEVLAIEPLSENEFVIDVSGIMECDVEFFIEKPEAWYLEEGAQVSIFEHDWNERYAWAGQTTNLRFTMKLAFDESTSQITSHEVTSMSGPWL